MPPSWEPLGSAWVLVAVAVLGGVARQAHQWMRGHHPTWKHFVARAVISLFIGVVCSFILPDKSPWSFGISALLGWMGADGVSLLLEIVLRTDRKK